MASNMLCTFSKSIFERRDKKIEAGVGDVEERITYKGELKVFTCHEWEQKTPKDYIREHNGSCTRLLNNELGTSISQNLRNAVNPVLGCKKAT